MNTIISIGKYFAFTMYYVYLRVHTWFVTPVQPCHVFIEVCTTLCCKDVHVYMYTCVV